MVDSIDRRELLKLAGPGGGVFASRLAGLGASAGLPGTVIIHVAPRLRLMAVICSALLAACGGSSNGGNTQANTTGPTGSSNTGSSGNTGSPGGSPGGGTAAMANCGSTNTSVGSPISTPIAYVLDVGNTYNSLSNAAAANACVLGYPLNASGSVSPTVVITLPDPEDSNYVSLATDSAGNLYVGSRKGSLTTSDGEVLVFAAQQSGAVRPIRTITVPATQTSTGLPAAIAVDGAGNLYVATQPSLTGAAAIIYEFPPGSNGNDAPIRTLSVNSTGGWGCQKLEVDVQGNLLCALNELGQILIFGKAQSGSALPARTVSLKDSGAMVNEIVDFSLDPSGNIYVAATVELHIGLPITILEYPGGITETGNVKPISTISGDALPGSTVVSNIGLDRDGNLYVNEFQLDGGTTVEPMLVRFAAGTDGFAEPVVESLASFPNLFDPGISGFSVD